MTTDNASPPMISFNRLLRYSESTKVITKGYFVKISILLLVLTFSMSLFAQNEKLDIQNPKDDKELGVIKAEMKNLKSELKNLPSFQPSSVKGGDQLMVCFPDIKKNIAEVDACLKVKYDYYQGEIDKAEKTVSDWETEQGAKMRAYETLFATNTKQIEALKNVKVEGIGKSSIKESIEKIKSEMTNSKRLYDEDLEKSRNAMKAKVYGIVNSGLSDVLRDNFNITQNQLREEIKESQTKEYLYEKGLIDFIKEGDRGNKHGQCYGFLGWEADKYFTKDDLKLTKTYYRDYNYQSCVDSIKILFTHNISKFSLLVKEIKNKYNFRPEIACFGNSPSLNCKSSLCSSMINEYISASYMRLGANSKKVYKLFNFEAKDKVDTLISSAKANVLHQTQQDGAKLPPADFGKLVSDCEGSDPDKINVDNGLRGSKKETSPAKQSTGTGTDNTQQQ